MSVPKVLLWLTLLVYIITNIILLIVVEPGLYLSKGADSASWYGPALALLEHGYFVNLNSPSTLMTYRPPLYPLFEAIMLWIGNGKIIAIIIGQIILLWITGRFAGYISRLYFPKYEVVTIFLVVFNPNALGSAHLIQSDTLYAFFIVLTAWALIQYMFSDNKFKWGLIIGVFLGASCLVRPTGQYLILIIPIVLLLINTLSNNKKIFSSSIVHGIAGMIASSLIVFPWMMHNEKAGWGYVLVTSEIKKVYLMDSVIYAEKKYQNISIGKASNIIAENEKRYIDSEGELWLHLGDKEKADQLVSFYEQKLISYPATILFKSYLVSWIGFFGGGGGVNFHNLLSIEGERAIDKNRTHNYSGRLELALATFLESSFPAALISIFSYLYVIALRVLGLFGLIEMVKRKEYPLMLVIVGLITYFAMMVIFVGTSRYRLPVEFGLVVLALYGASFFSSRKTENEIH